MKKKWMKLVTMALMLVVLATALPFAQADAVVLHPYPAYRSLGFTNAYLNGVYAGMRASYCENYSMPLRETQTMHTQGISTAITVAGGTAMTREASAQLGYVQTTALEIGMKDLASETFSGALSQELGIAQSYTYEFSVSRTFTISEAKPSGLYRVTVVFPQKKVDRGIYGLNAQNKRTTIWTGPTIQYAPCFMDAYAAIENYSLGT